MDIKNLWLHLYKWKPWEMQSKCKGSNKHQNYHPFTGFVQWLTWCPQYARMMLLEHLAQSPVLHVQSQQLNRSSFSCFRAVLLNCFSFEDMSRGFCEADISWNNKLKQSWNNTKGWNWMVCLSFHRSDGKDCWNLHITAALITILLHSSSVFCHFTSLVPNQQVNFSVLWGKNHYKCEIKVNNMLIISQ